VLARVFWPADVGAGGSKRWQVRPDSSPGDRLRRPPAAGVRCSVGTPISSAVPMV